MLTVVSRMPRSRPQDRDGTAGGTVRALALSRDRGRSLRSGDS
jgi:hypothetical protein